MVEFWLVVSVLLVLAVAIVFLPLFFWRPAPAMLDDRLQLNVGVYRQRLSELNQDRQEGLIDDEQLAQLRTELQRSLLLDARKQTRHVAYAESGKGKLVLLAALLVLIPAASWFTYKPMGAIDDWSVTQGLREVMIANQQGLDTAGAQQELIASLEAALQDDQDNIQYLVLLAEAYMSQSDFSRAVLLFAKLVELLPEDPDANAYYAQALYLSRDNKIDSEVQRAIDATLALNPHNMTVLGMVGMDAFERGNYRQAISAWQTIVDALPSNSSSAEMLRQGIEQARLRLKASGEVLADVDTHKTQVEEKNAVPGTRLSVTVSLADSLQADPGQTVFIFARAASGPPMPLAVARVKVSELPVTVTLDDSMAMAPSLKLSSFKQVAVIARISMSGGATAQSGDLQGLSAALDLDKTDSVAITIDQRIP